MLIAEDNIRALRATLVGDADAHDLVALIDIGLGTDHTASHGAVSADTGVNLTAACNNSGGGVLIDAK